MIEIPLRKRENTRVYYRKAGSGGSLSNDETTYFLSMDCYRKASLLSSHPSYPPYIPIDLHATGQISRNHLTFLFTRDSIVQNDNFSSSIFQFQVTF